MKKNTLLLVFVCAALSNVVQADKSEYIKFEGLDLEQGRFIWLGTCENCHAYGIADSPNPLKPKDWEKRVEQDIKVLYTRAIEGYFGPDDSMMPPKGGNDSLSDEEVKAAVDYMIKLAKYYIDINKE